MGNGLDDRIRFLKTTISGKSLEICERVEADVSDRGPACTMFSSLQNWNGNNGATECKDKLLQAKEHLRFVVKHTSIISRKGDTSSMNILLEQRHGACNK